MTDDTKEEYFRFLDTLRDSGVTNMFGAGAYLEEMFELPPTQARQILTEWMRTFDQRHPQS